MMTLVLILASAIAGDADVWVSANGKSSIEAELVRSEYDKKTKQTFLILRKADAKEIRVKFKSLNKESQKLATKILGDRRAAERKIVRDQKKAAELAAIEAAKPTAEQLKIVADVQEYNKRLALDLMTQIEATDDPVWRRERKAAFGAFMLIVGDDSTQIPSPTFKHIEQLFATTNIGQIQFVDEGYVVVTAQDIWDKYRLTMIKSER